MRKQAAWHVPGKIRVRVTFGRRDTRADLDNLIKPILDMLMAAGRISDDRNVVEIAAAFEMGVTGTRIEIRAADYIHKPGIAGRKHGDMWASVAAIGGGT
jgi:Holliday junction resolvase RusA-like endonuclease